MDSYCSIGRNIDQQPQPNKVRFYEWIIDFCGTWKTNSTLLSSTAGILYSFSKSWFSVVTGHLEPWKYWKFSCRCYCYQVASRVIVFFKTMKTCLFNMFKTLSCRYFHKLFLWNECYWTQISPRKVTFEIIASIILKPVNSFYPLTTIPQNHYNWQAQRRLFNS